MSTIVANLNGHRFAFDAARGRLDEFGARAVCLHLVWFEQKVRTGAGARAYAHADTDACARGDA
eukprot:4376029-Lingulodinium_polyedra.AAC.1